MKNLSLTSSGSNNIHGKGQIRRHLDQPIAFWSIEHGEFIRKKRGG